MQMTQPLSGQTALVTGASGSIGAEVARTLAGLGARVAAHGRNQHALDDLSAEIARAGGVSTSLAGDVRDETHLGSVVAEVTQRWGPINILVTLAGGDGSPTATASLGAERWRSVIETDLTSVFLTISAVLPSMLGCGDGSIVTVASSAGRRPSGANAAYAAAKAGVIMLTQHLAKEYGSSGLRVNCVAPAIVETATLRTRMPAAQLAAVASQVPLGRVGQPADVARAVAFLVTEQSSWITGSVLDLTGGMTL